MRGRPKKYLSDEERIEARRISTKLSKLRLHKAKKEGILTKYQAKVLQNQLDNPDKIPKKKGRPVSGLPRGVVLGVGLPQEVWKFFSDNRGLAKSVLSVYYVRYGVNNEST